MWRKLKRTHFVELECFFFFFFFFFKKIKLTSSANGNNICSRRLSNHRYSSSYYQCWEIIQIQIQTKIKVCRYKQSANAHAQFTADTLDGDSYLSLSRNHFTSAGCPPHEYNLSTQAKFCRKILSHMLTPYIWPKKLWDCSKFSP